MKIKIIILVGVVVLLAILLTSHLFEGLLNPEAQNEITSSNQLSSINIDSSELSITQHSSNKTSLNTADNDKLNFALKAFQRKHYDVAFRSFNEISQVSNVAKFHLAKMYEQGLGVAQNPKRAIRNYSSAAEHGSTDAMKALGTLFSNGMLLGKNYKEAFRWFHQAAMAGDTEAQGRVALMYKNGQGTSADIVLADAWLDISCAEKTRSICSLRKGFLLTPEQLKQSHLLSIKFQKMVTQSASNSSYTRIN
ncbi:tetratricopeptide repeat protein [Paraglaciecola arctica]|uniref:tetratricopeptide repeat protein n=1 Tax=Paraglaciecola arctica TaxID=1128911 RepID=UPI001C07412B|nr:tetratricopeptide repeat protein [Paraglaciecola arctica]MBU3004320.1 sel1 repeat family protein [Paraglaciecola arctica]